MKYSDGLFEWRLWKAERNWEKHGVRFEEATEAFADINGVEEYDELHSQYEHRFNLIGQASQRLLFIVFTEPRRGIVNIISAREAEADEQEIYEQNLLQSYRTPENDQSTEEES